VRVADRCAVCRPRWVSSAALAVGRVPDHTAAAEIDTALTTTAHWLGREPPRGTLHLPTRCATLSAPRSAKLGNGNDRAGCATSASRPRKPAVVRRASRRAGRHRTGAAHAGAQKPFRTVRDRGQPLARPEPSTVPRSAEQPAESYLAYSTRAAPECGTDGDPARGRTVRTPTEAWSSPRSSRD
jgi:hypothetical protein